MKNDILHSGKLFNIQRQQNYKRHIQKINQISKKRASNLSLNGDKFIPTYPSGYKMEQQLKLKDENDRLVRKLYEIKKRKKFEVITPEDQFTNLNKLNSLHKKYREYERNQRQQKIQQQNEKLVEKLLDRIKNGKNKDEFNREDSDVFILRKSRSKKKGLDNQQKSRLRKSSQVKRNKSQIHDGQLKSLQKMSRQRKRNYSTLLPTIQKVYGKKNQNTIDQGQVHSMLERYDKSETRQNTKREKNKQNTELLVDKYEMEFQNDNQEVEKNHQEGEKVQKKQQINPIDQIIDQKIPQINEDSLKNPQQEKIQLKISTNNVKSDKKISAMDPTLKFQKMKNKKTKKREKIQQIKQQNQYQQQLFDQLEQEE